MLLALRLRAFAACPRPRLISERPRHLQYPSPSSLLSSPRSPFSAHALLCGFHRYASSRASVALAVSVVLLSLSASQAVFLLLLAVCLVSLVASLLLHVVFLLLLFLLQPAFCLPVIIMCV